MFFSAIYLNFISSIKIFQMFSLKLFRRIRIIEYKSFIKREISMFLVKMRFIPAVVAFSLDFDVHNFVARLNILLEIQAC